MSDLGQSGRSFHTKPKNNLLRVGKAAGGGVDREIGKFGGGAVVRKALRIQNPREPARRLRFNRCIDKKVAVPTTSRYISRGRSVRRDLEWGLYRWSILQTLAKALTNDGLVLPPPVRSYLRGQPQPLALDTRERLVEWCTAHGYSDEQRQHLNKLIRTLVTRERYLQALASGLPRIDISPVSTPDLSPMLSAKVPPKVWPPSRRSECSPNQAVAAASAVPETPAASALQTLAAAVYAAIATGLHKQARTKPRQACRARPGGRNPGAAVAIA